MFHFGFNLLFPMNNGHEHLFILAILNTPFNEVNEVLVEVSYFVFVFLFCFLFVCFLAALCSLQDLSSLTRDQTRARILTTGPLGNSLLLVF